MIKKKSFNKQNMIEPNIKKRESLSKEMEDGKKWKKDNNWRENLELKNK